MTQGTFDFVCTAAPCTAVSAARSGPPGPRPLRLVEQFDRLPKAELTPREWGGLRWENELALKIAES
eukprot:4354657-Lingulodinium_polyedra.AAC.1